MPAARRARPLQRRAPLSRVTDVVRTAGILPAMRACRGADAAVRELCSAMNDHFASIRSGPRQTRDRAAARCGLADPAARQGTRSRIARRPPSGARQVHAGRLGISRRRDRSRGQEAVAGRDRRRASAAAPRALRPRRAARDLGGGRRAGRPARPRRRRPRPKTCTASARSRRPMPSAASARRSTS